MNDNQPQRPSVHKLEFRFNNGNGAILCSSCYTIIVQGSRIDWKALQAGGLGPQYCAQHQQIVAGLSPASPILGEQTE